MADPAMFSLYAVAGALGVITSYTDIRFHKIKNIHILCALIAGIIIYLYLIAVDDLHLDMGFIYNLLIAFILGLILYLFDFWAAGDAKLFFTYAFLIPFSKYSSLFIFPSIALFINIFLIGLFITFVMSFFQKENWPKVRLEYFSRTLLFQLAIVFLMFFSFGWVVCSFMFSHKGGLSPFLIILSAVFIYRVLHKLLMRYGRYRAIAILLFFIGFAIHFLLFPGHFSLEFLGTYARRMFLYSFFFIILKMFIGTVAEKEKAFPFAPFMLVGALNMNTGFLLWVMHFLALLR